MIYLVCRCGKHLSAPDEVVKHGCLCPGCGSRLGGRERDRDQDAAARRVLKKAEKATTTLVRQLGGRNPSADEVPTYRVMPVEEAQKLPSFELPKRKRRQRGGPARPGGLDEGWFLFLTFPLRMSKFLALTALLLACATGLVLAQLQNDGTLSGGNGPGGVAWGLLAMLLVFLAGYWSNLLTALSRGESTGSPWDVRDLRHLGQGMLRALVCFLAGPACLLAVATWFWLSSGELTFIDYFLICELVAVAAAYGLFTLTAVAVDDRLSAATPAHTLALIRRLDVRTAAMVASLAGTVALVHLAWIWSKLTSVHHSGTAWLGLILSFMSLQVCGLYLVLWLGKRCSELPRPQPRKAVRKPVASSMKT